MLPLRFIDRVKFIVERQFVKGAGFQLLVVAIFIGLISLVGGLLVRPTGAPFDDLGSAIWWAFLRLTDPGYLGDDVGNWRRFLSTLLTISGYVVFLGALVAIMTRWLIAMMSDLERGLTPVTLRNHIVVLGWNNQTIPLLGELLDSSGRMKRFLERHDTHRLRLVVLSENVSAGQLLELKNEPGIGRRSRQVILRSGIAIQPDALHRVACLQAAAVIVPSSSHGPGSLVTSDVETVKALLSIAAQARQARVPLPYVVAEIQDLRKRTVIERAYPGAVEVVAGDATISSLMVQNVLHPGLSEIYNELLTAGDGNEIYVRGGETVVGQTLEALASRRPRAIVLGLLRPQGESWDVQLMAPSHTVVEANDRVILLARDYLDTDPDAKSEPLLAIVRGEPMEVSLTIPEFGQRILVLGWNRRAPTLISEFDSYPHHRFEIDLVSVMPGSVRETEIQEYAGDLERVRCRHLEADYMVEGALRRLRPDSYDSILLLSSDRLASGEEADARAMVGYLQLEDILSEASRLPQVILELSDPDNQYLLTERRSEMIISPMILSHVLAQVALRRELRVVLDELFTQGGAEFLLRQQQDYRLLPGLDFGALEAQAAARGEIALGVYRAHPDSEGRHLMMNPERRTLLHLDPADQLVVLGFTGQ